MFVPRETMSMDVQLFIFWEDMNLSRNLSSSSSALTVSQFFSLEYLIQYNLLFEKINFVELLEFERVSLQTQEFSYVLTTTDTSEKIKCNLLGVSSLLSLLFVIIIKSCGGECGSATILTSNWPIIE